MARAVRTGKGRRSRRLRLRPAQPQSRFHRQTLRYQEGVRQGAHFRAHRPGRLQQVFRPRVPSLRRLRVLLSFLRPGLQSHPLHVARPRRRPQLCGKNPSAARAHRAAHAAGVRALDRGQSQRAFQLYPDLLHPLRAHRRAGRQRLHAAHRVRPGPHPEPFRAARAVNAADDPRRRGPGRLRRSGGHGHQGNPRREVEAGDNPDAPHAQLPGETAAVFPAHRHLLQRDGAPAAIGRHQPAEHRDRFHPDDQSALRAAHRQDPFDDGAEAQGNGAVHHGDAALSHPHASRRFRAGGRADLAVRPQDHHRRRCGRRGPLRPAAFPRAVPGAPRPLRGGERSRRQSLPRRGERQKIRTEPQKRRRRPETDSLPAGL